MTGGATDLGVTGLRVLSVSDGLLVAREALGCIRGGRGSGKLGGNPSRGGEAHPRDHREVANEVVFQGRRSGSLVSDPHRPPDFLAVFCLILAE